MVNSFVIFVFLMPTSYFNQTQIAYPISNLKLNPNLFSSYIELVADDYGNNIYVNKKTTIDVLGDFFISSHPIFNKLNDVYNDRTWVNVNEENNTEDYRFSKDIYLEGQSYFIENPYSKDDENFENLIYNQTVQKKELEKFIHENCLHIDPIKMDYTCVQYAEIGWRKSLTIDDRNPLLDGMKVVKFLKPSNYCRFKDESDGKLYKTDNITFSSNSFVTIIGKVKVFDELAKGAPASIAHRTPYYTAEMNCWAAAICNDNVLAITELHNFDKDGVAYFSLQIPIYGNQEVSIAVPFRPKTSIAQNTNSKASEYDILADIPINSVAVFYYTAKPNDDNKKYVYFENT